MKRNAHLSACGLYRYRLGRQWRESGQMPLLWVMLNPSTADADIDDPTIRRCIAFSQAWGYGALWVGNVYAYRSTDPAVLRGMNTAEAIGPYNYSHLWAMACQSERTVCAWGNHAAPSRTLLDNITGPGGLWCLGTTKSGQPKHPLYLKGSTTLREWSRLGATSTVSAVPNTPKGG